MSEALKVKNGEERTAGGGFDKVPEVVQKAAGPFRRFREFLHEVRAEMRNVTWPTPVDVKATTIVVIATVMFFGMFLFLVDQGASRLVDQVFRIFKP